MPAVVIYGIPEVLGRFGRQLGTPDVLFLVEYLAEVGESCVVYLYEVHVVLFC